MSGGYSLVVGGTPITAAHYNQYVARQVITRHATTTARDSAIATDAEDGMYADTPAGALGGRLARYNTSAPGGAAWQLAVERPVHIARRADGTNVITGATSLKTAYSVTLTVTPSTMYRIRINVMLLSGASANAEFLCNVNAAGAAIWTGDRRQQRALGDGVIFGADIPYVTGPSDTSTTFAVLVNSVGGVAYDVPGALGKPFICEVWELPALPGALTTPPVVT